MRFAYQKDGVVFCLIPDIPTRILLMLDPESEIDPDPPPPLGGFETFNFLSSSTGSLFGEVRIGDLVCPRTSPQDAAREKKSWFSWLVL